MDQSVVNNFRDEPEQKKLYCDTCNSLLPAPGYFCVQCEPPCGPDSSVEDELIFSQAMLRICLLVLLFLIIATLKLDINILDELNYNQKETQLKIPEDEDFKIFFKINTGLANVRMVPNLRTSKIIDTLPMGTQVEILDMVRGWSKVRYKLVRGEQFKTGWIATKLLSSEPVIK